MFEEVFSTLFFKAISSTLLILVENNVLCYAIFLIYFPNNGRA